MAETYSVLLEKLIEQMELENVTKDVDVSRIEIVQTDVNRPALQLAGFLITLIPEGYRSLVM